MEFDKIQKMVFIEYIDNGFLHHFQHEVKPFEDSLVEEIGLIHTEVAEAQEYVRKYGFPSKYDPHLAEELADICIRTFNVATRLGIDLEKAIILKNEKNLKRPKKHNNMVI
jgi:NTP pyrophosphatase (non-canonical NTP hydrolase)